MPAAGSKTQVTRQLWWIEPSLLGGIYGVGFLLRFEALYIKYNAVMVELGAARLQEWCAALAARLHPASFAWILNESLSRGHYPYTRDQLGYVELARSMGWFYEAQVREPLFVFATKVGLALTDGHDIALSFMSTFFSSLIVLATYALGRAIGGRFTGLISALLVAVEQDLIWWGTDGWRADLFTVLAVAFAWCCLRMTRQPSDGRALILGFVGALACLTRITALSFVLPGIVLAVWPRAATGRRQALGWAAAAFSMVVLLVAPYLISCWWVQGDPFYTFSLQSEFYDPGAGLGSGLADRLLRSPVATLDDTLQGMTVYLWANKWRGLEPWSPQVAAALSVLSIAGLVLWAWIERGRTLLAIFAASTLPFAYVAGLPAYTEWRLTMHAYPFFIVSAVFAAAKIFGWLWAVRSGAEPLREALAGVRRKVAATLALLTLLMIPVYLLPMLENLDDLSRWRATSVAAGYRDAVWFADGWHQSEWLGNQMVRRSKGERARLRVPMRGGRDYSFLIRMDPLLTGAATRQVLEVRLNNQSIGRLRLRYSADRMGAYELTAPAEAVRSGFNRLELVSVARRGKQSPSVAPGSFLLWYVRLTPGAATSE